MSLKNNKTFLINFIKNKSFNDLKVEFAEKNIIVKEQGALYLLFSENNVTDLDNQCNGIILEKETNKIICSCQNKMISTSDYKNDLKNFSDVQIEYCEDGTLMRLYNYKNEWFLATTKCFDARNSFWVSNKNYHDLFFESFKSNIDTFDKNNTYIFILIHVENRLVISHKQNKIIYLSCINNNNLQEIFNSYRSWADDDDNEDTIQLESVKTTSKNVHNLTDMIDDTKRGFIFRVKNSDNTYITYLYNFLNFEKNKLIRGNNNRIHFRYLQVLTKNPEFINDFNNNYPEYKILFSSICAMLEHLIKKVHGLYINSHVKHNIKIEKAHLYFKTLMHLHSVYKKENIIITRAVVADIIYKLDTPIIARLLGWQLKNESKTNTPVELFEESE
jgi:hypothetical protein